MTTELPYDPAIPLLGIYLEKNMVQKNTWIQCSLKHCLQQPRHAAAAAKSLQSCPTLCDPREGSPAGSPIPGILQARTLEWGAIAFSE